MGWRVSAHACSKTQFSFIGCFLRYLQFIKYPPSDPDKVREEVQARIERERKMKEQRKEYLEQMQQLAKSAERSKQAAAALEREETNALTNKSSNAGWFSWLRFGQAKTDE